MGVETILIAAAATSATSTLLGAYNQHEFANYQADQANADAKAAREEAALHADNVRRIGRRQASAATAALAASGLDVGKGTSAVINKEIIQDSENEAAMTIMNGQDAYRRGRAEASGLHTQGNQAITAGFLNAGGTLLSAGAEVKSGWWKKTPGGS